MKLSQPLKIIFAGTPEFAAHILQTMIQSQHNIIAVYTQPDRPAGRGRKLTSSPVKQLAEQHQIPIYQPLSLRDEQEQKKLAELQADLMIVVAYGLILPKPVLEAPKLGCLNVHASLLPRWRGAAPIQRAILAGDSETGITIMQMDVGLDTGDMLYKLACPIQQNDTSETLHDRLANLGSQALMHTLSNISNLKPEKQNDDLATYAHKIKKEEAHIDWSESTQAISRKVHAFNPWPVAFVGGGDSAIRIWEANVLSDENESNVVPGTIVEASAQGIDIATAKGVIRLQKLQLPGGRVLSAADVLNSRKSDFTVGKIFS